MTNGFYAEKLRKPNFLWRIIPYGFVRLYVMKYHNEYKEIIVQSSLFGSNESGIKGGNCKRFNYVNLGKGLYYIVNSTGVLKAENMQMQEKIERNNELIKSQEENFVFDEDEKLT